jgi:hypothetical protein
MGTVVSDPTAAGKSALPPGGDPRMDDAYEAWLRATCDAANTRWLDRHWPGVPRRELVRTYQITNHLFKWTTGLAYPSGEGPNFQHRIRFVSIQFHYRRAELVAEVESYIARLMAEAEADGRVASLAPGMTQGGDGC